MERFRSLLSAPSTRGLGLRVLVFEGIALGVAAILATAYGVATGTPLIDAFLVVSFVVFLLLLFYGFLSTPGSFSRPRLTPLDGGGRPSGFGGWRASRREPAPVRDLVLYTGMALLFLVLATLIGRALGG